MISCVYLIEFGERIKKQNPPYYYIGSKTLCTFKDNKILNKFNKEYLGSSSYPDWDKIKYTATKTTLLYVDSPTYDRILVIEKIYQMIYNAVESDLFFNKSYATNSYFNAPGYGLYKKKGDSIKAKKFKLHKNDPLVISGEYVGITEGTRLSVTHRKNISLGISGKNNPFYGRRHSDESIQKIRVKKIGKSASDETKQKMSRARKGVPKTVEHRAKIGRIGLISLKHPDGRCVRICKEQEHLYKAQGFMNPFSLLMMNKEPIECPHCGKIGTNPSNMKRWHFDKCRELNSAN